MIAIGSFVLGIVVGVVATATVALAILAVLDRT